jgi:hypothetical protein
MKIREGAYYRTRGGDVVGPMAKSPDRRYPWITFSEVTNSVRWATEGEYSYAAHHSLDLISEVYVSDTPPDTPLPDIITDQPCKTLRDEFAGRVLAGMMADHTAPNKPPEFFADLAYKYADAMMEARKK